MWCRCVVGCRRSGFGQHDYPGLVLAPFPTLRFQVADPREAASEERCYCRHCEPSVVMVKLRYMNVESSHRHLPTIFQLL